MVASINSSSISMIYIYMPDLYAPLLTLRILWAVNPSLIDTTITRLPRNITWNDLTAATFTGYTYLPTYLYSEPFQSIQPKKSRHQHYRSPNSRSTRNMLYINKLSAEHLPRLPRAPLHPLKTPKSGFSGSPLWSRRTYPILIPYLPYLSLLLHLEFPECIFDGVCIE